MFPRMLRLLSVMAAVVGATASSDDVTPREVFPDVGEYIYYGTPRTWGEAIKVCLSNGAHLLVIDSYAEAAAVRQMMTNHGATYIHLGFHDLFLGYSTILGDSFYPTNGNEWAPGWPTDTSRPDCGGFKIAGTTNKICTEVTERFICEVPSAPVVTIPPGYTVIPKFGYYKLSTAFVTWPVADQTCRDEGAHLVILEAQQEADALTAEFGFTTGDLFHVGLHRRFGGNNNFVTVLGGSLQDTGYTAWRLNEPHGTFLTYPYVGYQYLNTPGLVTTMSKYRFICKIDNVMAAVVGATASSHDVTPRVVYPGVGEYFYIGTAFNWTEAVLLCLSSGAHLLVIDSTAEAAAARDMMTNHGATFIHLGFHDQFIEGKYNNILGNYVQAPGTSGNEWAVGSPKGGATYNCGGFSHAGITDTRCEDKEVFICEVPTATEEPDHPGFTLVPNFGFYKYSSKTEGWLEAEEACREEGAHLLTPHSHEEIDALVAKFNVAQNYSINVGAHRDFGKTGIWYTVSGGFLEDVGFAPWIKPYPLEPFYNYPYAAYLGWSPRGFISTEWSAAPRSYFCKLNT